MNRSLRPPLNPNACPECGLVQGSPMLARAHCAKDPFDLGADAIRSSVARRRKNPSPPFDDKPFCDDSFDEDTVTDTNHAELLHWIGKATEALELAEAARDQLKTFAQERDRLALEHATRKEAAIGRLMQEGMARTKAEAAARTDAEFHDFCNDELYASRETAYWEAEFQLQIERARQARTVVAALTQTLAPEAA